MRQRAESCTWVLESPSLEGLQSRGGAALRDVGSGHGGLGLGLGDLFQRQ